MADVDNTAIDELYKENSALIELLLEKNEVSFQSSVSALLGKTLVLASASYFEARISDAIVKYVKGVARNDDALVALVRNKVVERQYSKFFSWGEKNRSVNPFFGMFGSKFKESADKDLKEDGLKKASKDFLELGDLRNVIVHENFALYTITKTPSEVYDLYKSGLIFVEYVESKLSADENGSQSADVILQEIKELSYG